MQRWLDRAAVRTLYIQKASPWENGYVESFNGKLRDELLNRELFLSVPEARYVIDEWRRDYSHRRPHGSLKWQTPAAYAATLPDRPAGAFPAASRVESTLGTAPSLRLNTRIKHDLILSQPLVLKSGGGHLRPWLATRLSKPVVLSSPRGRAA